MNIRPAIVADARRIAEIHVISWQAAYRGIMPDSVLDSLSIDKRAEFWAKRLTTPEPRVLVGEIESQIVGWVLFGQCRDVDARDDCEIYDIYLDPKFYRRGIGTKLWSKACGELAAQGVNRVAVWVLSANTPSRAFYEAMGAILDHSIEKHFEQDGAKLPEVRYWCPTKFTDGQS